MVRALVTSPVVAALAALACACSAPPAPDATGFTPSGAPQCDPSQMNPNGVCYPQTELGTHVHDRIPNLAFESIGKTTHLAEFYDPQQAGVGGALAGVPIKLIHLFGATAWSTPSRIEADFIAGTNVTGQNAQGVSWAATLGPLGVLFVQVLMEGSVVESGATLADLKAWIAQYGGIVVLDSGAQALGVFFDAAAVPFNADIDARSMELLSADVGFDLGAADQMIKTNLAWVTANPPMQ